MRRTKKLLVLLCLLLAVGLATFGVIRLEERKERIRSSGEVILAIPSDSVTALSWSYEDTTLSFHKGDSWLYDGDEAFPVDQEKLADLLALFQSFTAAFTIDDVEDYGQYGLDAPVCTIQLETGEQTYTVTLGDFSKLDSQRYVSIGDGRVYLATEDPLDRYDTTLRELIRDDRIPALEHVSALRFSGAEDYSIFYEADSGLSYSDADCYFTQRAGETLPLDSERVERYLTYIRNLGFGDYVSYQASQEELERYGLDQPELTIQVDYSAEDADGESREETFLLAISRDPAELEAAAETEDPADDEAVTAYLRVGDSSIIYELSASNYRRLRAAGYDDLRHPQLFWGDFDQVTEIDIRLDGQQYRLSAGEGEDGARVWYEQETQVEIEKLQAALEQLSADRFTDQSAGDKEELRLTLHLDREDFPQTEICLYRYDGDSCLAAIDGQTVSLVNRPDTVELIEAVNQIVLGHSAEAAA